MTSQETRVGSPRYGGNFETDPAGPLPFVVPGELVEAPTELSPLVVLEPSPLRVPPACVHFGVCGGCHYQHVAYAAQLDLKVEILRGLLAGAGLHVPAVEVHQAEPWEYRNRIRLRVQVQDESVIEIGYSHPGSNDFLGIRMCPIAAPLLWRAAEALLAEGRQGGTIHRWLSSVSHVELFTTADESRLQMLFLLQDAEAARNQPGAFQTLCKRLHQAVPELSGAGAILNPDLGRRARRGWEGQSWEAPGLNYESDGRSYWVTRGAFFQVNRRLLDRLVGLVTENVSGALAWDLFAGVGLFSRALAERFTRVIAVEAGAIAAADLLRAGRGGKGRQAFEAVESSTLDFLRVQQLQRERPDLIVLDPPRAGLGPDAPGVLTRIAAPTLVYVFCDPATLARDLTILTREVYQIDRIALIDLFPQTFHLETVVYLSRR